MHAVRGETTLVLSELVIEEAYHRFRQDFPEFLADFELLLNTIDFEHVPAPSFAEIEASQDFMRDSDCAFHRKGPRRLLRHL